MAEGGEKKDLRMCTLSTCLSFSRSDAAVLHWTHNLMNVVNIILRIRAPEGSSRWETRGGPDRENDSRRNGPI